MTDLFFNSDGKPTQPDIAYFIAVYRNLPPEERAGVDKAVQAIIAAVDEVAMRKRGRPSGLGRKGAFELLAKLGFWEACKDCPGTHYSTEMMKLRQGAS